MRLIEKACRVTGLTTPRHLIASHIKPWSISNNTEKIDGSNGLLLSPHVDHLFDKGFISFENAGDIKVSRELDPQVLKRWSIDIKSNVSHFDSRQSEYLEYHRKEVFITYMYSKIPCAYRAMSLDVIAGLTSKQLLMLLTAVFNFVSHPAVKFLMWRQTRMQPKHRRSSASVAGMS